MYSFVFIHTTDSLPYKGMSFLVNQITIFYYEKNIGKWLKALFIYLSANDTYISHTLNNFIKLLIGDIMN